MAHDLILGLVAVAAVASAVEVPVSLGQGWNLARTDLWNMNSIYSSQIFADIPETCFFDTGCSQSLKTTSHTFNSVSSWEDTLSNSLGLGGSVSSADASLTLTLKSSFGQTSTSSSGADRSSVFVQTTNRQKCYQLRSACLSNPRYLLSTIRDIMSNLPKGKTDARSMDQWVSSFINRFGSHVTVASEHGAMLKAMVSVESQSKYSSHCLKAEACADFSFVGIGSPSLCPKTNQCSSQNDTSRSLSTTCVTQGGSSAAGGNHLCSGGATTAELDAFLKSGDFNSGSSTISYRFKPLSDVLLFQGLASEAETLKNAVSYQSCTPPQRQWTNMGGDHYGCTCMLKCENGGELDPLSCHCKCRGDENHGWKGETCSETYGSCQPGKNSGRSAKDCPKENKCASWFDGRTCDATEVCCLADVNALCCPFGSACSCPVFHTGCDCVPDGGEIKPLFMV